MGSPARDCRGRTVSQDGATHRPQKNEQMQEMGGSWGSGIPQSSGELASQWGGPCHTEDRRQELGRPIGMATRSRGILYLV